MPSGTKVTIDYDKIYYSNNYGPFRIISETKMDNYNRCAVIIEFINTGTREVVPYYRAMKGNVKDVYAPSIFGVACIGHATCRHPAYTIWHGMISRCYNKTNQDFKRYGGSGVTVCKKWICFEYFLQDLPYIDNYNKWISNTSLYHLDKDLKQQGVPQHKKVYSLETCCFLLKYDNIARSNIKNNTFIGLEPMPSGNVRVRPRIENVRYHVGVFENREAAANAYNNFMNYHFGTQFKNINQVPYIPPEEVIKYNKKPKTMCIIKSE